MKYDFTETVLSYQKNGNGMPDYLRTFGDYIQIYVSETPLSFIIADEDTHYLVEERNNVQRAWGPFTPQDGCTYYLYVDVNAVDASVTRGYTSIKPVYSTAEPPAVNGTHWYDMTSHKMKVYVDNVWTPVIRLFVASFSSNELITYETFSDELENTAGYIVYDYDNKGVRKSNGKFLTTEDNQRLNTGSFSNAVNPEDRQYVALVTETIPAFTFAAIAGDNKICLASSSNVDKLPIGMVLENAYAGDTVNVYTEGVVINQQWNFTSAQIGQFVYCDAYGEISFTKAMISNYTVRVGKVLSTHAIHVKIEIIESTINGTIVIGQQGPKGDKGDKGDTGDTGPQGPKGDKGDSGTGSSTPSVVYLFSSKVEGVWQTIDDVFKAQSITPNSNTLYVLLKNTALTNYYVDVEFDYSTIVDECGHDIVEMRYFGDNYGIDPRTSDCLFSYAGGRTDIN